MLRNKQHLPNALRQLCRVGAIAFSVALIAACQSVSQTSVTPDLSETAIETQRLSLTDSKTGHSYDIFVYDPAPESIDPKPVVYMTDANTQFEIMVDSQNELLAVNPSIAPGAIIVGIGYSEETDIAYARGRDLTNNPEDISVPTEFGGDEAFRRFVVAQLKSWISSRYAVDADRETLFGHSFGGLFTVRTLIQNPNAFDSYVAASTSLWWGDKSLLRFELDDLSQSLPLHNRPRVLVTVGELEEVDSPNSTPTQTQSDGPPPLPGFVNRSQVTDAAALADRLNNTYHIPTDFIVIAGEGHISVIPMSISEAISFALSLE